MPTYEYRCPNGHTSEKFSQTISGSVAEILCPSCGLVATRILSAGGGLVFKGSGFYLTDYGKNAHANRGGAKTSTSDKDASAPSKAAEAKPEKAASESKTSEPKPAPKPAATKSDD